MLRQGRKAKAALAGVAALAAIALLLAALSSGSRTPQRAAARSAPTAPATMAAAGASSYGPPSLARYKEAVPHVSSSLTTYGVQGQVQGAPTTPPDELPPLSPAAFRAPVAAYRAYSVRRLGAMRGEIAELQAALGAGDRGAAQTAWRSAYADYLNLGAVYLEGPVSGLDQAIDGASGGLPGGASSPRFSGLHRLERGLWTGAPLASLRRWARKLDADVARLAKLLPRVAIDPGDYATRAHEILEDAARDQLSGTDAPWSGAGVLGTAAGVAATTEVVKTLSPVLSKREGVLPTVNADLASLRATLARIQTAHGGALPATGQLTQDQSERLQASLGQALEGLAQVPGALETSPAPVVPKIPAADIKVDP
jgi:high-affinity iron transporter